MSITIDGIYEKGAFRPTRPLPLELAEGESVAITVVKCVPTMPSQIEDDAANRIKSARSFEEWLQITRQLPSDDAGYDILKAMDENRKWSGGAPLLPVAFDPR